MAQKLKDGFLGQRMLVMPKAILQKVADNPLLADLYFTDIGFFPNAQHHFRRRAKGSREFVLIYCQTGSGTVKAGDEEIELTSGRYFILPPHVPHAYGASESNPWTIYWLHFTGSKATLIYHRFCALFEGGFAKLQVSSDPAKKFHYIFDLLARGYAPQHIECANISLWNLLRSFIYPNMGAEELQIDVNPSVVDKSIRYLLTHLEKQVKVEDLASRFNYSASHFFNLFKRETGYSPIQYFNYLKMQRACELLLSTKLSIKEISFELGYKDQLYFSRLFKKNMGLSPQQYRSSS